MLIANARVARSAIASVRTSLRVHHRRLFFTKDRGGAIDLSGYLLLPGLINAHDHLEFNLFPRLGHRIYTNATDWADDIYQPERSPVREHLSLPKNDRLLWGGLRNLLSGVTTVAHHNPDDHLFDDAFPLRVVRRCGWAHSLAFSPDLAARYAATPPNRPFIIHAAEGTDDRARAEIAELNRLGVLTDRTVLVHALGIDQAGRDLIEQRGSSIVWCPSSNLRTYGRTLSADLLRSTALAFGTDSAISSAGDMLDELRIASQCGASMELLYSMVTDRAARILRLGPSAGKLKHGGAADFIAVPDRGQTPAAALFDLVPELVVVGGAVRLISPALRHRFGNRLTGRLHSIALEGRGAWHTPFDIPRLLRDAQAVLGPDIRLAGKRVHP